MEDAKLAELLTLRKVVTSTNIIIYYNEKEQIHRIHGPAVIYPDGSKEWHQYGKLHRPFGPAVEWVSGLPEWWINGEFIRR